MFSKKKITSICVFVFISAPIFAQSHVSVPLENKIYYILEQAELKGLCAPLTGSRPYTQSVVLEKINEVLDSRNIRKLNAVEREILEQYVSKFSKPKTGVDLQRGAYYNETGIGKNDTLISANVGVTADIEGSTGLYSSDDRYFGTEIWVGLYANGDLGQHVSYNVAFEGGLVRTPRKYLGKYNTYYETFDMGDDSEYRNEKIDVYSEPLTHFPYTYKKRWDGSVHFLDDAYGFGSWPESLAIGYNLNSELTSSFLDNKLIMRAGRLRHEWGSTSFGSSLALNQSARPFAGLEAEFNPVSWFNIATLTGFLEYYNTEGEKASAMNFQNAYSITMFQFRYKSYLFLDIGETVVWPKRFEFAYLFPLTSSIMYQNSVGDFDNFALIINAKAQYPGIGNIWFSLFWDEARLMAENSNKLDRTMIAVQTGVNLLLPFLSFSSIKMSYTKVNPYTYTHNRNYNPWYGDIPMETSYTNNGVSLGYYLPPNSDEFLVSFQTMPTKDISTRFQFQLIRHGADFGSSAVDGSNLLSELDPRDGRDGSNPVLMRYFLKDGAYQWSFIFRLGAEWNVPNLPVTFFGEAGVVYSYFTNIEENANVTGMAHPYSKINTDEYPKTSGFIAKIGVRIFHR